MPDPVITPTRRLSAKERRVFERVVADFPHLTDTASDMLTRYAETSVRLADATKEVKHHPTVKLAVVNRSTGNIVGYKEVRNPAWRTLAEAQSQLNSLSRRLLIDPASENKRLILQSKKARSFAASEEEARSELAIRAKITEEQIQAEMERRPWTIPPWCQTEEKRRDFVVYWLVCDVELGPDDLDDNGL